jgi:hypothetical protein
MNKLRVVAFVVALGLTAPSCGSIDRITGGEPTMQAVAELWSDVPPMDGMTTAQQIEMPTWLKVLARPIMDQMMKGLNNGKDAGHWDWTAFTLSGKTPADVQAFYTPERMGTSGWQQGQAACIPMTEKGVLCSFTKTDAGKTTGLIVIAATDEQKTETSVFFLRAEGLAATPAANQPTRSSVPLSLSPIAPITIGQDLAAIDLCRAIPTATMEAVLGRTLVKAPQRFDYYDTPGASGCQYAAQKEASGEAHYGYIVLTPIDVYHNQPLYHNVEVSGIGESAYFNNGADTRQLWVKVNDHVAFVVAFGDVASEEGEQAIARLLVAAIK